MYQNTIDYGLHEPLANNTDLSRPAPTPHNFAFNTNPPYWSVVAVAPSLADHDALLLTRVHDRVVRTGAAQLTDPDPPTPARLRTAERTYRTAIDHLTQQAGLAASGLPQDQLSNGTDLQI